MRNKNQSALDQMRRETQNALNRALTKIKREQRSLIIKYVQVKQKSINFYTTQKRAAPNDMSIKLFTSQRQITPLMLPRRVANGGTVIKINDAKSVFIEGYGLNRNRKTGGRFLISAKERAVSDFELSKHSLSSSYGVKNGVKFSQPRDAFIIKGLADRLDELALKDINNLMDKAQIIFAEELEI